MTAAEDIVLYPFEFLRGLCGFHVDKPPRSTRDTVIGIGFSVGDVSRVL